MTKVQSKKQKSRKNFVAFLNHYSYLANFKKIVKNKFLLIKFTYKILRAFLTLSQILKLTQVRLYRRKFFLFFV